VPEKLTVPQLGKKFPLFYLVYKSQTFVPILSQINPFHPPFYVFKIYLNIIVPSTPRFFKWLLSLIFPRQYYICLSPLLIHVICPRSVFLCLVRQTLSGEEQRSCSPSLHKQTLAKLHLLIVSHYRILSYILEFMWLVLKMCNIESNIPNISLGYHTHLKPFPVQFSFRQILW
jgi:hypothetical protein